jgi:ornithine cyclodeaminase/alanine dehydrogenase-like protein (mu-crystallin family)
VDDRDAVMSKEGDLLIPMRDRAAGEMASPRLTDLLADRSARENAEQITLYKSVGLGDQDLIVAEAAAAAPGRRP